MKKGFTLIEFLSIIVILGIVAMITISVINNIIEITNRKAAIASARTYIEALEKNNILNTVDNKIDLILEPDIEKIELNSIKGTKPISGNINYTDKNLVDSGTLCVSGYLIKYEDKHYNIVEECSTSPKNYNLKLNVIGSKTIETMLTMKSKDSEMVNVSPEFGYYFESVTCTEGYKTNLEVGSDNFKEQVIKVSNIGIKDDGECNIYLKKRSFNVTYDVEGTVYNENIEYGSSALNPKSFTPTKSNYTFIGWSKQSNGEILDSMIVTNEGIILYAVFLPNTLDIQINDSTWTQTYNKYDNFGFSFMGFSGNTMYSKTAGSGNGTSSGGWVYYTTKNNQLLSKYKKVYITCRIAGSMTWNHTVRLNAGGNESLIWAGDVVGQTTSSYDKTVTFSVDISNITTDGKIVVTHDYSRNNVVYQTWVSRVWLSM